MECSQIRNRLDAWTDGELADDERAMIDSHLEQCRACLAMRPAPFRRRRACSRWPAPPCTRRRPCPGRRSERSRTGLAKQGFSDWWHSLGWAMQGAVCTAALAGFFFGAVLAANISIPASGDYANPYHRLYADNGGVFLP